MTAGAFVRRDAKFRGWPEGPPERYHLYAALACPWSQRTVIVRTLAGLEDALGISYAHPYRDERGWRLRSDQAEGFEFLAEAYEATQPGYDDRISCPVLWDKERGVIVSNESADIVRMLDAWGDAGLYPEPLRTEIDELNAWIYRDFQNGVYRAGFSKSQEAYDEAFDGIFAAMERLEALLDERRYLAGDRITLADWRLFPTLVRFDVVYYLHFRCNGRRVVDCPNLWGYTRELYQQPGVADTVAMDEIREHYYTTHDSLNPKRIIPRGPLGLDFTAPHGRG
ncbi:MAG TPA: glutathione S-transferase C-terminal domain-containing protein [Solirubrobacteraceae bacterium]|nr:glutathione S-transferase C-terminal domain-containing protein [Solirubrobacteraceae bacterium]